MKNLKNDMKVDNIAAINPIHDVKVFLMGKYKHICHYWLL
jgi:hypothetical protein